MKRIFLIGLLVLGLLSSYVLPRRAAVKVVA
jgi:hypothetical protein